MFNCITGQKPKTDGSIDGVNSSKELDGKKPQPINQFRLTNKAAGKNTKKIKEDWNDSITTAHKMLVNVNEELNKILVELEDISNALKKIGNKKGLDNGVKKFNNVQKELITATHKANKLVGSFNKSLPPILIKAGSEIKKLTEKDYKELEEKLGKDKFEKTKKTFAKIMALGQNVKTNLQNLNQSGDHSGRKKTHNKPNREEIMDDGDDESSSIIESSAYIGDGDRDE